MSSSIKELREKNGFSQQQVADMLGINRVTYVQSENAKREWKSSEIEQMSKIFDVPVDVITGQKEEDVAGQGINKNLKEEKFREVMLYILNKVGIKPNIGKTVLYKLLYFSDFNHYEKTGKSITGIDYIRLPMGPAPYNFDTIAYRMKEENKLIIADYNYGGYYQKKYFPNEMRTEESSSLSEVERETIDAVIDELSDMSASSISEYSHGDMPWQLTEDMQIISYMLAKKRQYPYSVMAREEKKNHAFDQLKVSGMFDDLDSEPDLYEDYR